MKADIERWNARFAGRAVAETARPDPLLESLVLPGSGTALDLAAGSGQDAVWLAEQGLSVIAVDGSIEGLRLARALAHRRGVRVQALVADLDHFEPRGAFALVTVLHYLNRSLFRRLPGCLAEGGLLVVKTFNRDFLAERPGFNPDYVLGPGELPTLFPQLRVLRHEQSPPGAPGKSLLVARREASAPRPA